MTPEQIGLVQNTWGKVTPIAEPAAAMFYQKLFEMDPALKPLFKSDLKEQGRKLMTMINTAVNALNRLDEIVPAVQGLARRHVDYGVKPKDYETVGVALLWTLEQGLGPAFTPAVKEAWATVYTTLAGAMKEAAYSKT